MSKEFNLKAENIEFKARGYGIYLGDEDLEDLIREEIGEDERFIADVEITVTKKESDIKIQNSFPQEDTDGDDI